MIKRILSVMLAAALLVLASCSAPEQSSGEPAGPVRTMETGSREVGFVSVPEDWTCLQDEDTGSAVKAASPGSLCTITLDVMKKGIGENFDLEKAASRLKEEYEKAGAYDIALYGDVLDDCEAIRVFGNVDREETKCGIVGWITVDSENDVIRLVTVEGPLEAGNGRGFYDAVQMVQDTYRVPEAEKPAEPAEEG